MKFKPKNHKIKAVIYGASGSGKTVLGSTAPNPIFASAENGLLSIAEKGLSYVDVKSIKDLAELLKYLQEEDHGFESVVIDSITEINEIIKTEIEKNTGKPLEGREWQKVAAKIRKILRGFRDLPMHVIMIAQEKVITDEDKIRLIVPSLNGKAATEIAYFMDIVGYVNVNNLGEHLVDTMPNPKYLTKDRSGKIGNNQTPDFGVWVELIKSIDAGEEEVVVEYEPKNKDQKSNSLPNPQTQDLKNEEKSESLEKENKDNETNANKDEKHSSDVSPKKVTKIQKATISKVWDEMWALSCELLSEEKNKSGSLKYTPELSESTFNSTLKSLTKKESVELLTYEEAKSVVVKIKNRLDELEDQMAQDDLSENKNEETEVLDVEQNKDEDNETEETTE